MYPSLQRGRYYSRMGIMLVVSYLQPVAADVYTRSIDEMKKHIMLKNLELFLLRNTGSESSGERLW
jgi:hypothetical protein